MKFKNLTAALAILALGACSSMGGSAGGDFDSLKEEALASISAAKAAGNEWRDSNKLVSKAEEAFKKGDVDKAIGMLKQAKMQGELAVAQAKDQANAADKY